MSEYEFRRVKLYGSTLRLSREEWDEVEIVLGVVADKNVEGVTLCRDADGEIKCVAIHAPTARADYRPGEPAIL